MRKPLRKLVPTINQFQKWSLPAKAAYIALVLTVVLPLLIWLVGYGKSQLDNYLYSYDRIKTRLVSLAQSRNLDPLHDLLGEIKDRQELGDLYNFYYGYYILNSPLMAQDPTLYFQKVSPHTTLYVSAKLNILHFYQNRKKSDYTQMRREIAAEVKRSGSFFYFYFLLNSLDAYENATNLSVFDALHTEFMEYYASFYDFPEHKPKSPTTNQLRPELSFEVVHIEPLEVWYYLLYRNKAKELRFKEQWLMANQLLQRVHERCPAADFRSWMSISFGITPLYMDKMFEFGSDFGT